MRARDLLMGWPFGFVKPDRPPIALPAVDGRTIALSILADYIGELTFRRPGAKGAPPIAYNIDRKHIHIEQPHRDVDLQFPSIVVRPGEGDYNAIGLTSYIDEATEDKYGKGTVVQEQSEYQETITLECWAEEVPQRRSMVAGLEVAMVPTEQLSGLRFRMPRYFDRTVTFTLNSGSRPDDPDAARARRWALLQIEMRFHVCSLCYYGPLIVQPDVQVLPTDVEFELAVEGYVTDAEEGSGTFGSGDFGGGPWGDPSD
jgi:hypothetical protein